MTDLPELADLGFTATAEDTLYRSHAQRVARTLDLPDDVLASGLLPPTWIWTYFAPTAATARLRSDGHPAGADDGPLAGLDRRMFIGGSLDVRGGLELDADTSRSTRIVSAAAKEGSSGPFVIVDVEHVYRHGSDAVIVERQNLMYRRAPSASVPAPGPDVEAPTSLAEPLRVVPDERLLFRYSALTFNTHRIHYDRPYATEVEKYPGLVVHGPLTATLLAHLAAGHLGTRLSRFEFRATTPTFAGTPIHFVVDSVVDGEATLRAVRGDGAVAMTATAAR